ncbi:MAG: Smr/MutS family protein [Methylibium sp.]|jgi:DNA-nicking Smr family endonuclease
MGKRGQDDEEGAALWARIAESAKPLTKDRARSAASVPPLPAPKRKPASPPPAKPAAKTAPKPIHVAPGPSFDRQVARKLDTGKLAVEARLDLHGLKQAEAHAALRKFLKSAQTSGKRHVLVITGKGAGRDEARSFYEEDERGVLRQAVPHWLGLSDLAPLVVSFSPAPRRLGGDGALYVRLRRAPAQKG